MTVVSLSPATTCALVTTRPGAAIQPDPSTPSPQAVPSTRTTLSPAACTSGSCAIFESGAATFGLGPWTATRGSMRCSALISELDGGNVSLSARRIAERWTAVRRPFAPGALRATAPKSHATPRATTTRSSAPPDASAIATPRRRPAGPSRRRRIASAIPSSETATIPPISSAPARAVAGAYGECEPSGQQRRAEPAAQEGADRESAEAEQADDQALLVAPEPHGQGESENQPVEAGHGFPNTSVRATNFALVNPPVTRSRTRDGETPPPRRPIRSPRAQRGPLTERQRRLRQRALPLGVVALVAFIFGVISSAGSPEQDMAERFVNDWAHQDYKAMHDELSDSAQAQYSALRTSPNAYRQAQEASTATAIDPGGADGPKSVNGTDVVDVGVGVRTRLFGKIDGALRLPLDGGKVAWDPHLTFPNLQPGEQVGRRLTLGRRAAIIGEARRSARRGADRRSLLAPRLRRDRRRRRYGSARRRGAGEAPARRLPRQPGHRRERPRARLQRPARRDSPAGSSWPSRRGPRPRTSRPGHQGRVLATAHGSPGQPVRTTIDPRLQSTTVNALGGQSGGVAVLNARNGNVLALAGSAYSSPQPPGSTFKVITTTAALEGHDVKLSDTFPVVTEINPDPDAGARVVHNAHDEACGGTFTTAFAKSCNSVFAPLGVKVGAERLVDTAERYGFNQPTSLYNASATAATEPGQA